jgi:hypothetical protein
MPSSAIRRASAATLCALLAASLLAGCTTTPTTPPGGGDALAGAATATLARSSATRCAGDPIASPASSDLMAYSALTGNSFAKREAEAAGKVLKLGNGRLSFVDFKRHAATYDGAVLGVSSRGLEGGGMSKTTLRLSPHTSTRASKVPHSSWSTNQLSVLRVVKKGTVLRGFTLLGTAQGHLYNGIRVEKVRNLRADHVRVWGIPGDNHQPPGETFAINDYRTTGSRWSHIRIDGKRVGATGFGVNSSTRIRICDAVSSHNPTGMGFAFWQSSAITCVDCRADDNGFSGFNFERTTGKVTLVHPSATGNKFDMRIASDQRSAKFLIEDPVLRHGVWTIWMPRTWYVRNKQKRSDITLTIHGKRRNDLIRFRTY